MCRDCGGVRCVRGDGGVCGGVYGIGAWRCARVG